MFEVLVWKAHEINDLPARFGGTVGDIDVKMQIRIRPGTSVI
jgi:hypothetical protein